MKIVFMGTPDFAVPSLERLVQSGYEVAAVFSQPDKPKGRGYQTAATPVKACALAHKIPVYQPATLRSPEAMELLSGLQADLMIVVAYGKILPAEIIHMPPLGCVNVHGSLLPKYRGAAPIQWAVLNGETKTGVTVMQMDEGVDTGDMLHMLETELGAEETAPELFERLAILGADALLQALAGIENGSLHPVQQDNSQAVYAKMIDKSMCPIDWNQTASHIHNQIRGLAGWPVAMTMFHGKNLKVHAAVVVQKKGNHSGEVIDSQKHLVVACGGGTALELLEVQLEGKKRMKASDFLLGNPIQTGEMLGV